MATLPVDHGDTLAAVARPARRPLPEIGASRRVPPGRVLAVAAAGAGLAFVDATIVNVAFPDMQADFAGTSLGALSWILNVMAASHEGPIVAVDVTARVTAPLEDAALSLHETLVRTLTLGSLDTTAAAQRHADLSSPSGPVARYTRAIAPSPRADPIA